MSLGQAHVIVVPQEELLALVGRYVRQQRDYGNPEPAIVQTVGEAYNILNINTPRFDPVHGLGGG